MKPVVSVWSATIVGMIVTACAAAQDGVPLRVSQAPGMAARPVFPVTTGVPFAEGRLRPDDLAGLSVETADGKTVFAQFSVRGVYPRTGDVRWLGVDLLHDGTTSAYRLVADGRKGPPCANPVILTETEGALLVQTGSLRARIPRAGRLLDKVWIGEQLLIDQAGEGNWLTDQEGRRFTEAPDPSERATIELAGSLHTVIRVAGRYADVRGRAAGRWIARLHFYAGVPCIRIVHTFIWLGMQDERQVRNLAIGFGTPFGPTRALADRSDVPASGGVAHELSGGEPLSLVQNSYWHWGHGQSHFGIYAGPEDNSQVLAEGQRAGHWIRAHNKEVGVTLALKDLWQQYPKELMAESDRLTCYLWSSNFGGPVMDLRLATMEKDWGAEITEEMHSAYAKQYALWKARPEILDPHGTAKSHELILYFSSSDEAAEAAADALADPPLMLPDPEWTYRSDVFGPLGPRDPENFPEREARLDGVFADVIRAREEWGDYGFFFYGSGPHQSYRFDRGDGHIIARAWRMQGILYGVPRSIWLAYLRSGKRELFRLASAATRFYLDVATCHEEHPTRHAGDWEYNLSGGVIPWSVYSPERGRSGFHHLSFGNFIEHGLLCYYLTGDQRSLDVVREYAGSLKAALARLEGGLEQMVATMQEPRSVWQKLGELGVLYQQFAAEDPWFEEAAKELGRLLFDPESPTGHVHIVRRHEPSQRNLYTKYTFYKVANLVDYLRTIGDVPERRLGQRTLVRMAEWTIRTAFQDSRQIALLMAFAYRFSGRPMDGKGDRTLSCKAPEGPFRQKGPVPFSCAGNAAFLTYMKEDLRHELAVAASTIKQTPERFNNRSVPNKANTTTAVLNTAYYVGALRERPHVPARTRLLFKEDGMPPADMVFRKPSGTALTIEIVEKGAALLDPRGEPPPKAWLGEAVAYYRFMDNRTPLLYRTIRVPPDAPEGLYRIRLSGDAMAVVYATNATKVVLAGASALDLGSASPDAWYFKLPPQASELKIRANDPALVELTDPDGRVHPLPGGEGKYRVVNKLKGLAPFVSVNVPPGTRKGLWSIRALNHCRVSFENVVPVFALARPESYFVPPGLAVQGMAAPARGPYVEGLSGQGLLIDGSRELVIRLEDLVRPEEGTLEFWFRTTWCAPLLPFNQRRQMLRLDGGPGQGFLASFFRGQPNSLAEGTREFDIITSWGGNLDLREQVKWASDSWHHLSLSWKQTSGSLYWALDIDGKRFLGMYGGSVGQRPAGKESPTQAFKVLHFAPEGHNGPFDAVVDNLRISKVARYADPYREQRSLDFEPDREMKLDADTLALFEFEGTPNGRGAGGQIINATLQP